jgi:hypothetical protein
LSVSRRVALGLIAVVLLGAAFLAGRLTAGDNSPPSAGASFNAGYLAGREAAFTGYDGGWAYGVPYVITLRRGGPGITYRLASRRPLHAQP